MKEKLEVVNLDEIALRWQVPVKVIMAFITEYGMNPVCPEDWAPSHWDLLISEKQKAKDDLLFPEKFRNPTEISAKTS